MDKGQILEPRILQISISPDSLHGKSSCLRERKGDHLQMFVWLTRPGRLTAIIKDQTIELLKTQRSRPYISQCERRSLAFKIPREDQKVVRDDAEFIEHSDMSLGKIGDKQVFFVGQKGIARWSWDLFGGDLPGDELASF